MFYNDCGKYIHIEPVHILRRFPRFRTFWISVFFNYYLQKYTSLFHVGNCPLHYSWAYDVTFFLLSVLFINLHYFLPHVSTYNNFLFNFQLLVVFSYIPLFLLVSIYVMLKAKVSLFNSSFELLQISPHTSYCACLQIRFNVWFLLIFMATTALHDPKFYNRQNTKKFWASI